MLTIFALRLLVFLQSYIPCNFSNLIALYVASLSLPPQYKKKKGCNDLKTT